MTDATKPPVKDVHIDRLVLDIPGFDPTQARALALGIADGLARTDVKGEHTAVSVSLAEAHGTPADMAARIVAALMERLV